MQYGVYDRPPETDTGFFDRIRSWKGEFYPRGSNPQFGWPASRRPEGRTSTPPVGGATYDSASRDASSGSRYGADGNARPARDRLHLRGTWSAQRLPPRPACGTALPALRGGVPFTYVRFVRNTKQLDSHPALIAGTLTRTPTRPESH